MEGSVGVEPTNDTDSKSAAIPLRYDPILKLWRRVTELNRRSLSTNSD
jgi:hypothetical protein